MLPSKLYRGDSLGNSTKPERYRDNGLMTKQMNFGDPTYIKRNGLLKCVEEHLGSISSKEFYNSSCFLSFSSEKSRAEYYCTNKNVSELRECEEYCETNYIFTIYLDKCNLIEKDVAKGLFTFSYKCNPHLKKSNSLSIIDACAVSTVCEHCLKNKDSCHHFTLIDVVKFLEANIEYCQSFESLENAKKDFEWLIMPVDYNPYLKGFASLIPRSDIWDASHYYLSTKGKRDKNQVCNSGVIYDDSDIVI